MTIPIERLREIMRERYAPFLDTDFHAIRIPRPIVGFPTKEELALFRPVGDCAPAPGFSATPFTIACDYAVSSEALDRATRR